MSLLMIDNQPRFLSTTLQRNFESRIPFTGDEENLRLIQALALGIVRDDISKQLFEVKKPKIYFRPQLETSEIQIDYC